VEVAPSTGGLATGLKGPHEHSNGLWIGWPGDTTGLSDAQLSSVHRQLEALRTVPVLLTPDEVDRYYERYSNGVLWPLFHYFVNDIPLKVMDFEVYEQVNVRFADAVVERYQPGDQIWVQDYQLMLVPQLLRERLPDARIGFFLHIPFPSSEVFRVLPGRERILEGLLGADLIGFHTASYMRHFSSSVLRLLGAETELDRVRWGHRRVQLGVFPMGVDSSDFAQSSDTDEVKAQVAELRRDPDVKLLVGIDRLDYTKGIPRRLLAFEKLLQHHPELREKVRLVQVSVPSREHVEAYQDFRAQVDGLIGRIHGEFATPNWVPVHYLFRGLAKEEIVALYRAADVMLVTPLRDGMNLVAKEFIATRNDEDGVLVLSEFAGAANELGEALMVNPFDLEMTSRAFHDALTMQKDERHSRMRSLRRRVMSYDVHHWAKTFLDGLTAIQPAPEQTELAPTRPEGRERAIAALRRAPSRVLLLDYDGTLVPFVGSPELARPDPPLLELLQALASQPNTHVSVVSGRMRETLEAWLGQLPIGLFAEHGFWSKPLGVKEWTNVQLPPMAWRERVLAILEDFAARTPGARVEEKTASVAWHYRMADPEFGAAQANELKLHLAQLLSNAPVELLSGNKVLEIRPHGVHKGGIVEPVLREAPAASAILAMGDDRTDEDMFGALPPHALSVHVGPSASQAMIRLEDVRAARAFLRGLLG
jgi:trehalose 6-phosphate synthase/phosphatase